MICGRYSCPCFEGQGVGLLLDLGVWGCCYVPGGWGSCQMTTSAALPVDCCLWQQPAATQSNQSMSTDDQMC